jgi:hypothetical protein
MGHYDVQHFCGYSDHCSINCGYVGPSGPSDDRENAGARLEPHTRLIRPLIPLLSFVMTDKDANSCQETIKVTEEPRC